MRFEIIILFIAGFLIANIYSEGKYLKMALSWKKYYQMGGIAFGALALYWLITKNPQNAKNIINDIREINNHFNNNNQINNNNNRHIDMPIK